MPFDNTHVVHPDWSTHHRPVVAGTFTAECTIRRPGVTQGEFDPNSGTYTDPQPHPPHYTGGCRIQVLTGDDQQAAVADQTVTTVGYLVAVDLTSSTDTQVNDLVKVTAVDDNGDPTLVDHELTVSSFARGTLAWERDLTCLDQLAPDGGV